MSITWQDVANVAPLVANVPTGMQVAILANVGKQVDQSVWNEFTNDGMAYLAAHLATIRNNTGFVTEERMGPFGRSYSPPPLSAKYLSLSVFGVEYLRLLRIAVGPAVLIP